MAASLSASLVTAPSISPADSGGSADRSHVSMPCVRPYFGLKYQCEARPIV